MNDCHMVVPYTMAVQAAVAQVRVVAVGEPAVAKPEAEAEPDVRATPRVTDTVYVVAARRQRRPTAVQIVGAPHHPRWAPCVTGHPVPAVQAGAMPPSIVKRCPAPTVI